MKTNRYTGMPGGEAYAKTWRYEGATTGTKHQRRARHGTHRRAIALVAPGATGAGIPGKGTAMWYVVQVLSGQEEKACELIKRHVAQAETASGRKVLKECFVPRYQVERKFHGEYKLLERTLFPGYVIAVTTQVAELNRILGGVSAFTRILGDEKSFIPLDRTEMTFINSFTTEKHRVIQLSKAVAEGDSARVIEGPLMGCEAWIRKVNRRKGTARVEMTMFGRTITVEIGLAMVTKA